MLAALISSGYARPMRYLLTCLLALMLAQPALALNLPPLPDGTCTLNSEEDGNALPYMHLIMQHGADLKALFAECGELSGTRHGRIPNLSHYGVLFVQKDTLPPGTTRENAIAIISDALGLSGATSAKAYNEHAIMADLASANRPNLKNLNASVHGVLIQRPNVVIFASEQRHLGHHLQYAVAAVTALTVMDDKIVTLNLYAPLDSADAYTKLASIADSYIASMFAANQTPAAVAPAAAPVAPPPLNPPGQ